MSEVKMNEGIPLQFRGGPREENDQYTGLTRELTIDTDFKTIHVHDGTTPGGFPLLRADLENLGSRFTGDKITVEVDGKPSDIQSAVAVLSKKVSDLDKKSVPSATTAAAGTVKLVTAVNSSSQTDAATPSAVKAAYDLAAQANQTANSASTGVNSVANTANSAWNLANTANSNANAAWNLANQANNKVPAAGGVGSIVLGVVDLYNNASVPGYGAAIPGSSIKAAFSIHFTNAYAYYSSYVTLAGTWVLLGASPGQSMYKGYQLYSIFQRIA